MPRRRGTVQKGTPSKLMAEFSGEGSDGRPVGDDEEFLALLRKAHPERDLDATDPRISPADQGDAG